jgi:two-component system OmpR family response regulator
MKREPAGGHAARVLIVDDNVDLAKGLARLLQIHGHHVEIAYDGPSGLEKARESKPEFVLLDIGLPGMDGYELAAHLRRDDGNRDAVIIAISGYGKDEDGEKEAGFDHHLVKPIAPDILIKILKGAR